MASKTKVETFGFSTLASMFSYLVQGNGLAADKASKLVGDATRHDGLSETIYVDGKTYAITYNKGKDEYTVRIRPMSPADTRMKAVIDMHARIIDSETHAIDESVWSAASIAAEIRKLAPLGRSERWTDAVESYARFVETDGRTSFAYLQGSVYFAHAVL
jgi:hypothetical protein